MIARLTEIQALQSQTDRILTRNLTLLVGQVQTLSRRYHRLNLRMSLSLLLNLLLTLLLLSHLWFLTSPPFPVDGSEERTGTAATVTAKVTTD
jgi:hypothetical protein